MAERANDPRRPDAVLPLVRSGQDKPDAPGSDPQEMNLMMASMLAAGAFFASYKMLAYAAIFVSLSAFLNRGKHFGWQQFFMSMSFAVTGLYSIMMKELQKAATSMPTNLDAGVAAAAAGAAGDAAAAAAGGGEL